MNWTDANFDRNLKAIDFTKITAEELKRILDEVVKHSNCPFGSFYDARKGCISLDTFGLVPEAPRVIDIEALFAQPLETSKVVEKSGGKDGSVKKEVEGKDVKKGSVKKELEGVEGSVDFETNTLETLLNLLHQLSSSKTPKDKVSLSVSSSRTNGTEGRIAKVEEVITGIDEGEIPIVFQSGNKSVLRPLMEITRTSPEIVAVTQKIVETPESSVEIKIDESDAPHAVELEMEDVLRNYPPAVALEMGNVLRSVLQNMSVQNAAGNTVVVEPRIIKETFPMKMKLMKNSGKVTKKLKPLKLSIESGGGSSRSMTIKSPSIKSLNSELESALASFSKEGKLSGGKIALQYGNLFKNNKDKSPAAIETDTTTRYFQTGDNQAFVVAQVPLARMNREFEDDQLPTTAPPTDSATVPPTVSPPVNKTTPKNFRLVPALVDSGKTIVKAKQQILKNFFPGWLDEGGLSLQDSSQMKEDASYIEKNVPKAAISFETVEGKTLSDTESDAVTEGMQLTPSAVSTTKEATKVSKEIRSETTKTTTSNDSMSSSASVETTTKTMNKN